MAVIQSVYQQVISSLAQAVSPVKEEITAWRQAFDVLVRGESKNWRTSTGVLISPWPDVLPSVFCLMVRIFRLMLVLLYIYK
jgi:hypothetical protein